MSAEDAPDGAPDGAPPVFADRAGEVDQADPADRADLASPTVHPGALPTPAVPFRERIPWATFGLAALLVGMFAVELIFGVSPTTELGSPSVQTLVVTGGSIRSLVVDEGEWYRMFTAAFLHGGFIHLLFNGVALVMAGSFLEIVLGRTWFLALYVVGALGGSALSLAVNPSNIVSVGASGAIMALLAAVVVVAHRLPGDKRGEVRGQLLRVLIPSLLPIATVPTGGGSVDYGAHLGGAVVGGLVGWLLLRTWRDPAPSQLGNQDSVQDAGGPRFARAAQLLTAAGVVLFAFGFLAVQRGYHRAVATLEYMEAMVPEDQLPALFTSANSTNPESSRALAERYPRDPRALLVRAAHLVDAGDLPTGKTLLQRALQDSELLRQVFPLKLEVGLRSLLVQVLLAENDRAQAKAVAAPICHAGPGGVLPEELESLDLCQ